MQQTLNVIWRAEPRGATISRLIRARAVSLGLVGALAAGPAALALRQLRLAHEAAVIERSDWPVWLGEVDGDAIRLLRAAPDDVLRAWQVDRKVGNVRNDGPELIKPVAELEPTLLSPIWSAQARE